MRRNPRQIRGLLPRRARHGPVHRRLRAGDQTTQIRKASIGLDSEPKITVQNIVASSDLGQKINLSVIAITLGLERVEYEPEQFPGLVYRLDEPKTVILLFSSGKLVCTGAKKPEDGEAAVDKISEELKAAGLLS